MPGPGRYDCLMHSTARHFSIALSLIAGAAVLCIPPAHAQTTIDVTKITCEQFLNFKVADPRDISIWLSGYFHGRQEALQLDLQQFNDSFSKLKNECFALGNTKRSVLELGEQMLKPSK